MEGRAVSPAAGASDALDHLLLLALLPPDLREIVRARFVAARYPLGSVIVTEGDEADALYVFTAGRARVLKRGERGEEISLNVLGPGDSFGEMALLERTPRTATVRAASDVEVLRLDRAAFDGLLAELPALRHHLEGQGKRRALRAFFLQYSAFARLPVEALRTLLAELDTVRVDAGEIVVREGDPPGPMYVVEDGRLHVHHHATGGSRDLAYLRRGDFFGELSLMRDQPRSATVEAVTPCTLLRLQPETFRRLLQDHAEFRALIEAQISQYDCRSSTPVPLDFARELAPADATAHGTVGPGPLERRPSAAGLWLLVRPWTGMLVRALALAGVVVGLPLLLPVFTRVLVDRVLVEQDRNLLRTVGLALLGVLGLVVASMAVLRYFPSLVAVRADAATLDLFTRRPSKLAAVPTLEGHVEIHHLSFRYGGPESPLVLHDLSVEVPAGTRVAIVGRTGSGKTTLVKCLGGLLTPTEGTIRYDGIDAQTLDQRQLRQHIGFVLQERATFDQLLRGRTAFVIARRLSTTLAADLILVLENGALVEHGTHDALMRRRGLYSHLVSQQLEL